jgi:hypothetical protein
MLDGVYMLGPEATLTWLTPKDPGLKEALDKAYGYAVSPAHGPSELLELSPTGSTIPSWLNLRRSGDMSTAERSGASPPRALRSFLIAFALPDRLAGDLHHAPRGSALEWCRAGRACALVPLYDRLQTLLGSRHLGLGADRLDAFGDFRPAA